MNAAPLALKNAAFGWNFKARKTSLRGGDLSRTVSFRQGLWTEDLRTRQSRMQQR